jgi:phosphopantothenoylcysteine decarboxylase/phosphopantothenate--cysteine ligase
MPSADSVRAEVTAALGLFPPRKPGRFRYLVTAGPTCEDIDPVRFLSNRSTGRMGMAVAEAAHREGHQVLLVLGPTALTPPAGPGCVQVRSAVEMQAATQAAFDWCDVLVMSAAVADYQPAEYSEEKIHKSDDDLTLRLVRTPDVLDSLRELRADQIVVGFALDTHIDLEAAEAKRRQKEMNIIVANTKHAFGGVSTDAVILQPDRDPEPATGSKDGLALQLIERTSEAARNIRMRRTESMRFAARRQQLPDENGTNR